MRLGVCGGVSSGDIYQIGIGYVKLVSDFLLLDYIWCVRASCFSGEELL